MKKASDGSASCRHGFSGGAEGPETCGALALGGENRLVSTEHHPYTVSFFNISFPSFCASPKNF